MINKSLPEEGAQCPSKTGRVIQKTGEKLVDTSENALDIVAKAVQLIPNAGLEMANLTRSPEAASSLPSPTSTTTPETANPTISAPCASDAISPMTPITTPERAGGELALSATTASLRSLIGKSKSAERNKELQHVLRDDESQMTLYQIQLENWKPFTGRVKASIDIWGSSVKFNGGEYAVRAKQIAAAAQSSGLNDPQATAGQRLMMATALYKGTETYDRAFQQGMNKTEWKKQWADTLNSVAEFFGLGNKKVVSKRAKQQRKAE